MNSCLDTAPFMQYIWLILELTLGQFSVLVFDACLCVSEFRNHFCNPLITDSSDQSLIGLSGHSTFFVNHSLALPLSHVPKNCTWVSVYLTPKRPCNLSHHSIPVTNVSYTLRSELPEYSSGGLIFSLVCATTESSGLSS